MAQKRMFSLHVVDTDKFMDMSTSAQALYFHLGMHGDDDGFVSSPRKIARAAGCNDNDISLLTERGFIIPMDSGVVVITDWKLNNTIKGDRYTPTIYQAEKDILQVDTSGRYCIGTGTEPRCITNGSNMEPQIRLGKHSIDKGSVVEGMEADKPPSRHQFSPPTVEEVRAYCTEKGYDIDPDRFVDYYTSNGWKVGKNHMKDWKAAVRSWSRKEQPRGKSESKPLWTVGTTV